jgi:hypothetical protein
MQSYALAMLFHIGKHSLRDSAGITLNCVVSVDNLILTPLHELSYYRDATERSVISQHPSQTL